MAIARAAGVGTPAEEHVECPDGVGYGQDSVVVRVRSVRTARVSIAAEKMAQQGDGVRDVKSPVEVCIAANEGSGDDRGRIQREK